MTRGWPIRYKFLLVTTVLLFFCVATYLFMATNVFRQDKTELVYDLNRSIVNNLASDLDTIFSSATDKMRLAAYFFHAKDERNLAILRELLAASQDIVYVGGSDRFEKLNRRFFQNGPFAETYALAEDFFEAELIEHKPIPFRRLQQEGEAIWNASVENGPALIGYGKSVVFEGADGKATGGHYAVVAFLRADRILKALQRGQLSQTMIASREGEVLLHSDVKMIYGGLDQTLAPVLMEAIAQPLKSSVLRFRTSSGEFLGAYAKSANQRLLVMSQVSSDAAFSVVDKFLWRSGLVALMVLNLAFLAAIWFARSLTRPIEVLTSGMGQVADGNLETQIYVESRDEIAELAKSFNGMIRELRTSREALEEINRDLEKKVKERTQQLEKQNQAVKSAQEALLRTTRLAAVGEIAGRAAHEVLNPLTTILARIERMQGRLGQERLAEADLLRDLLSSWKDDFSKGGLGQLMKAWQEPSKVMEGSTLLEEDLANIEQVQGQFREELTRINEDAKFLHREAQRIGRIVQAMRGLSVVEASKEEHEFGQVVEDVANIMRDLAGQNGIEILVEKPEQLAPVIIDVDEMVQSLTNLVRNSIQSIVEKKQRNLMNGELGKITLALKQVGSEWHLRIADNGVGIADDVQKKLFETQFSTKSRHEGTGLGLNISRRFVRAVGGDIYLESSKSNDGAVFLVKLPCLKNEIQTGAA